MCKNDEPLSEAEEELATIWQEPDEKEKD